MDVNKYLFESASLATGGVVTVVVAYYLIRNDILNYLGSKSNGATSNHKPDLLGLRLQAHERMIVFVDRINPSNMLVRLYQQGVQASTLQAVAINEIKAEFQHNITQQLYLEATTWKMVRQLKDDTIAMINNATKHLSTNDSGLELSKRVLGNLSDMGEDPFELTISLIKQDVQKLF